MSFRDVKGYLEQVPIRAVARDANTVIFSEYMPKVSAVLPTTLDERRLPYIRAALDSILAQRGSECEVIVVHNGSSRGRAELLQDYRGRVRYIYEEVGNISQARNRGVREATGEFVAFLDDDDLWHRDKIALQAASMASNGDVDALFTDMELFSGARVVHESYLQHIGGLERLQKEARPGHLYVQRRSWFQYLVEHCPFLPSCWMVKRQVLLDTPFKPILSEDRELLWRLSRKYTLAYLDQVLTRKRDHDSNTSLDIEGCLVGLIEGARSTADWDLAESDRMLLRSWEANGHFQLGYLLRTRGAHSEALRHQVASLRLSPGLPALKETVKNLARWRGRQE